MSEREEKFETMLQDVQKEYDLTLSRMEKLKTVGLIDKNGMNSFVSTDNPTRVQLYGNSMVEYMPTVSVPEEM